jgi:hypothetical protein
MRASGSDEVLEAKMAFGAFCSTSASTRCFNVKSSNTASIKSSAS